MRSWSKTKITVRVALGLVALLVLIQAVPYGRTSHANPSAGAPARWGDAEAEQLARQSCYDCHSNETNWRWYSNVAPASWLVQRDVDEGRGILNFSEWDRPQPDLGQLVATIRGGGMPPLQYTLPHPGTKLSDSERSMLINGLERLYAQDPPGSGGG